MTVDNFCQMSQWNTFSKREQWMLDFIREEYFISAKAKMDGNEHLADLKLADLNEKLSR